jgi:hypothetical protein
MILLFLSRERVLGSHHIGTLVGRLSVLSMLKHPTPEVQNSVTGSNPFSPQNPNFDHSEPENLIPKMFIGHIHFKTLKHTQVLRLQHQIIKIHQLTKLLQLSKTTILITNSSNHDTQCINSSTTHVEPTTTTTFEHDFINNSTTTTLFIINFTQNPSCSYIPIFNIHIQQQQLNYHSIHVHNHVNKIKHEILQPRSN